MFFFFLIFYWWFFFYFKFEFTFDWLVNYLFCCCPIRSCSSGVSSGSTTPALASNLPTYQRSQAALRGGGGGGASVSSNAPNSVGTAYLQSPASVAPSPLRTPHSHQPASVPPNGNRPAPSIVGFYFKPVFGRIGFYFRTVRT